MSSSLICAGGFCSDVSRDVCYCAWNKESAPRRIGRVTFPLFLLGLWKAICWRRGILCFNASTISVEFNYRCNFFFSLGRGCLILKGLILNGMEIDSINCMCGGIKDKGKWNVTGSFWCCWERLVKLKVIPDIGIQASSLDNIANSRCTERSVSGILFLIKRSFLFLSHCMLLKAAVAFFG